MTTHHAVSAVIGLDRVALSRLDRPDERAREHDLAGLERKVKRGELSHEPGDAICGMVEHACREPSLLDDAVAITERTDPTHICIERTKWPAAGDDAGIGGIVRDGVDDLARGLGRRADALDARVEDLERRDDEIGGVEDIEDRAIFSPEPRLHHEGELGLDPRRDETLARHLATV